MKKPTFSIVILLLVSFCFLASVFCPLGYAAVPRLINYQGRLTDSSGTPLNGAYELTFRIYDAETGGMPLWEEVHPGAVIQKGVFGVLLGSTTPLDLTFDKPYFLEIKVGDEVMSPRQRITSAAYAIAAETADKIKADLNDNTPGYLADKVDNESIKYNPGTKKIYSVPASTNSNRQFFTENGTFTVPEGIRIAYITMCGGGGGGGGGEAIPNRNGGGGGVGGVAGIKIPYNVIPGRNYSVIVGAGGFGGAAISQDGANGGVSSFDSVLRVQGGAGGQGGGEGAGNGNPGTLPTLLTGDANGAAGGNYKEIMLTSGNAAARNGPIGGGGAGTFFGSGGNGGIIDNPGGNATGYGAGGGGGGGHAAGGNGAPGFVLVEW